jgi:hypothetical protein
MPSFSLPAFQKKHRQSLLKQLVHTSQHRMQLRRRAHPQFSIKRVLLPFLIQVDNRRVLGIVKSLVDAQRLTIGQVS